MSEYNVILLYSDIIKQERLYHTGKQILYLEIKTLICICAMRERLRTDGFLIIN